MSARIIVFVILDVIGRVTVAETVGKNLVKHNAFRPVGNVEPGYKRKLVFRLHVLHATEAVIRNLVVVVIHRKMIGHGLVRTGERDSIIVEIAALPVRRQFRHKPFKPVYHGVRLNYVAAQSAEFQRDFVAALGLVRRFITCGFVREYCFSVYHIR